MASLRNIPASPTSPRASYASFAEETSGRNGRPLTGPAADAAAAALRDFARGRPGSKRSSATSAASKESNTSMRDLSARAQAPSLRRPSSQRHSSPGSSASPLKSSSSGGTTSDRSLQVGVPDPSSRSSPNASQQPNRPNPQLIPITQGRGRLQYRSETTSRSQTPRNISHLGQDYTRYFLPVGPPRTSENVGTPQWPLLSQGPSDKELAPDTYFGYTSDPEKAPSWLLDDRLGAPFTTDAGKFPMYTDEKEMDDDLHMPYPDDDVRLKPKLREYFARGQLWSLFGLILMLLGLATVFILLPVLSYTGTAIYSYPYHSDRSGPPPQNSSLDPEFHVNNVKYPLFKNIRHGLIDPTTPASAMTRTTFDGQK